jgi:adenylosuccinate lyase
MPDKLQNLTSYFSEFGLIRFRLQVEIEYFIALCQVPLTGLEDLEEKTFENLRAIYKNFDGNEAQR